MQRLPFENVQRYLKETSVDGTVPLSQSLVLALDAVYLCGRGGGSQCQIVTCKKSACQNGPAL